MRILIVEDEKSIAKRIERLLMEILGEKVTALTHRSRLEGAIDFISHHEIDLLLLDLNLNGHEGFNVLKSMLAESFDTIIISAYKDKAIEAFEYGVVDFVPKPFDKMRLKKALDRIEMKSDITKTIIVKKQGELKSIPVENIRYIKADNIYSEIYIDLDKKELSNKSLEQLERLLPDHFARIHKSYIANMNDAEKLNIHPGSKYELQLKNEILLPVGRTKYKEIKASFFS